RARRRGGPCRRPPPRPPAAGTATAPRQRACGTTAHCRPRGDIPASRHAAARRGGETPAPPLSSRGSSHLAPGPPPVPAGCVGHVGPRLHPSRGLLQPGASVVVRDGAAGGGGG